MIKGVIVEINGKEIRLSMKDARKLKNDLNDLIEKKVEKEYISYPVYINNPYTLTNTTNPYWIDTPTLICGGGESDLMGGSHSVYVNGEMPQMDLTDTFMN